MHGREDAGLALTQRLIDGAPIQIVVIDAVGTITFASDACARLFGYTAIELVGTNMLDHIDLGWNPLALDSVATALSSTGLRLPMLFRIRANDGSLHIVEATANSQVDDPVVQGMAVYIRSWNEQAGLDDILEGLAGDTALEERLGLFVSVMAGETLDCLGSVLHAPVDGQFTAAVASPLLVPVLSGLPDQSPPEASDGAAATHSVVGGLGDPVAHHDPPWTTMLASGAEQQVAVANLPSYLRQPAEGAGFAWCWAYPVLGDDNEVLAALVLWSRAPGGMEETYLSWIRRLVRLTRLVLDQHRAKSALTHAALHDNLTGLPNRVAFFARLQDALDAGRAQDRVGVLYLDLDGFKPVNDTYGHGAGDAVLEVIAARFGAAVGPNDLVARLGGDEFAVVVPVVREVIDVETLADRLIAAAREPVVIADAEVRVGVSIGVSVARGGTCSIDAVLDAADAALYNVKASSGGAWELVAVPTTLSI